MADPQEGGISWPKEEGRRQISRNRTGSWHISRKMCIFVLHLIKKYCYAITRDRTFSD